MVAAGTAGALLLPAVMINFVQCCSESIKAYALERTPTIH